MIITRKVIPVEDIPVARMIPAQISRKTILAVAVEKSPAAEDVRVDATAVDSHRLWKEETWAKPYVCIIEEPLTMVSNLIPPMTVENHWNLPVAWE